MESRGARPLPRVQKAASPACNRASGACPRATLALRPDSYRHPPRRRCYRQRALTLRGWRPNVTLEPSAGGAMKAIKVESVAAVLALHWFVARDEGLFAAE